MTDDEWQYDTDDFEESAGDPTVDGQPSDDGGAEAPANGGWRFSLDEVGAGGTADEAGDGWLNVHEEIEAGSPDLENAVFVALGVTLGLLLVWQLFL